jgi:hypothetical protein
VNREIAERLSAVPLGSSLDRNSCRRLMGNYPDLWAFGVKVHSVFPQKNAGANRRGLGWRDFRPLAFEGYRYDARI